MGRQMWFWGKPRLEAWRAGYTVRCDYPAVDTHEFVGFRRSQEAADRFAAADAAYYRRGPLKIHYSVVLMSLRDFELHARRPDCRSPDCPLATATAAAKRQDGAPAGWRRDR